MTPSLQQIHDFQAVVWQNYHESGRHDLPWRQPEPAGEFSPYKILVSELMLQQTQVARVIPKFEQFMELFPTVEELANSSLAAVLTAWSGLGYNRRAKFLHQAAKMISRQFGGIFPEDLPGLTLLPGVGKNTAGAITAYAYNQPTTFIETNIRTVYFYHFMTNGEAITDAEVTELVQATLDAANPREWYWALMDYGASLKAAGIKLNTLSKHYMRQSKFEGSKRQIRGKIIKLLTFDGYNLSQLHSLVSDARLEQVVADLLSEGLIIKKAQRYYLSD
ncbi:A/G-specific adenine glycosylase [Aeromicrobium sp.]|nr:A/G-specific adenine glycosylase [Candidatus Saccharibacteria bacterium]